MSKLKKEYKDKLAELKAKEVKTEEEEALLEALINLETKEKAQPFNRVEVDEAREVVEESI